jgi:hypothetical protein
MLTLALEGLLLAGAIACSADGSSPSSSPPGGAGSGGTDSGATAQSLPARVRRLSNAEYDASVRVLLGATLSPSVELGFPPDTKQGPANAPAGPAFTVNDAQRVDPVLAQKLDAAALAVVAEARSSGRLEALSPCADASAVGGEACARQFIQTFGAKMYRRPLSEAEAAGLLAAYHVGADGYSHAEGIDVVTRVLLQSPGFLYLTEIGEVGAAAAFTMTPNEIATSLSYLLPRSRPTTSCSQPQRLECSLRRRGARSRRGACSQHLPGASASYASSASGWGSTTWRTARNRRASIRSLPA